MTADGTVKVGLFLSVELSARMCSASSSRAGRFVIQGKTRFVALNVF